MGVVQYNEETAGPSVNSTCAAVVAEHSGLAALAAGVAHSEGLSAGDQSAPCISSDFEKDTVEAALANTSFSGRGCGLSCTSSRQWIFMSCNEFGYFQTTTGANQPFKGFGAVGIEFAGYQTCKAAFNVSDDYKGPKRNSDELLANTEYGARALEGINITIPNGSMDPWHALAIVNQTDEFFSNTQKRFSGRIPRFALTCSAICNERATDIDQVFCGRFVVLDVSMNSCAIIDNHWIDCKLRSFGHS